MKRADIQNALKEEEKWAAAGGPLAAPGFSLPL